MFQIDTFEKYENSDIFSFSQNNNNYQKFSTL